MEIKDAVRVLICPTSLDHRHAGAVGYVIDPLEIVLMTVSLEDPVNAVGLLKNGSYFFLVTNPMISRDVKPLVSEDESWKRRLFQVFTKPVEFIVWNVRVGPSEVLAAIGCSIGFEAGIENDEMVAM